MKKALTILALLFLTLVKAQEQDNLKVGLVLSGGGAKGLAHIGALKVIDSLGIKIDYVSGTSMGAIVGGLYASGYTGKQLDSIFNEIDFEALINDKVPRAAKTFYEKENSDKYVLSLPFKNFKIQLPKSISRGQNVFNLFTKLTLHVSDKNDFKDLPIPFFCIATNIETGEQIVLDKGSLPTAISASGSLPSLFQPIYIGDKVLTDGGVVNNYPIDELRSKGMDIIIGVDVQNNLANKEDLQSAPDILLQIGNFRTTKDMAVKSKKTDIYIKPDITQFSMVSFDKGDEIINKGVEAAYIKIKELKALKNKQPSKPIRRVIPEMDSIKINKFVAKGNKDFTRAYILGKLKIKIGEKVSYKKFSQGVNNLVATNNFDSFIYSFQPFEDGYQLNADIREARNKTQFKFAVHFDQLYKSAALLNLTSKKLLFNNDVVSLDVILGDNLRYNFEYFIDKGFYWSLGINSRYNSFNKSVNPDLLLSAAQFDATNVNKIDVKLSDFTNQFFVQTLFNKEFRLRAGIQHKKLKIFSETFKENDSDINGTTFENSNYFGLFGHMQFDSYDNKFFPKRGFLFDGNIEWYLSSSDYNNNFNPFSFAKANIGYALCLTPKLSFVIGSEGGFRIGKGDTNTYFNFALGGYGHNLINNFMSFYGYDYISLAGNSFVKGRLNLDYEIFKKHHINLAANFANVGDDIFTKNEWFKAPTYSGYAIGYGYESFLGPIEAKYTWSPETKDFYGFINLGFWF